MSNNTDLSYNEASFDQRASRRVSILQNPTKTVTHSDGYWIAKHLTEVIKDLDSELATLQADLSMGYYHSENDIKLSAMKWRHRMLLQQALNLLIKSKESIK